jgi:hypothetical protein
MGVNRIRCLLGFHRRDPEARQIGEGRYTSVCQDCGAPMKWTPGGWKLDRRSKGDEPH